MHRQKCHPRYGGNDRKEDFMSKSNKNSNASTVAGYVVNFIAAFIQIVFLVLKLRGAVNWDWVWIMAPSWVTICFSNCMLFLMAVIKCLVVSNISTDRDD